MIRHGIETWKCIALPSLLFMLVAVVLFLQAHSLKNELNEDIEKNGYVSCFIYDDEFELLISKSKYSNKGGYVYEFEETIMCQSSENIISVVGTASDWIDGTLIAGSYFSSGDNDISLVVTKTLISKLADKEITDNEKLSVWINKSVVFGKTTAKICGIIEDDSNMAIAYMSLPVAKHYTGQLEDIQISKSYCVLISDLKNMEDFQRKMSEAGIETSIDQGKMIDWKLSTLKIKDMNIMAIISLCGFVSSIILSIIISKNEGITCSVACLTRVVTNIVVGIIGGFVIYKIIGLWIM